MSIRQESDLSCEQLRSTLQNINNRLSNLQQGISNNHNWREKRTKETYVPKLDLLKIKTTQKENLIPQKKVTATFGEKQEQVDKQEYKEYKQIIDQQQQKRIFEQTPQKLRSYSVNGSQQIIKTQNNHSIQFKVSNASRLQNSFENQYYQSLHQSTEKYLNQSIQGTSLNQTLQIDQSIPYIQPTLMQNCQTRNNSLLSTPVKQIAHSSQQQTPLRRGNNSQTNSKTSQNFMNVVPQYSNINQTHQHSLSHQFQNTNNDLLKLLQNQQQQQQQQQQQLTHNVQLNSNMIQFRVPYQRQSSNIRNPQNYIYQNQMIRY